MTLIRISAQVVALMGAHSIGGAFPTNSGYNGKWTGPQNQGFSELFYANMINASITWTNNVSIVFCYIKQARPWV